MATNVMLTFYYHHDAEDLRRLEKYYFCFCYGVPLIPALAFIFIQTESKGHMYGNATLWCWVSAEWDIYRIGMFYGPVWFIILATIAIYIRCGKDIYVKRQQCMCICIPFPKTFVPLKLPSGPHTNTRGSAKLSSTRSRPNANYPRSIFRTAIHTDSSRQAYRHHRVRKHGH